MEGAMSMLEECWCERVG